MRPEGKLRRRYRIARELLAVSPRRVALLGVTSMASGFSEAAVLVLVVQIALAISNGDESVDLSVGPFSSDVSLPFMFVVAAVTALLRLGLHVVNAYLPAKMSAEVLGTLRKETLRLFLAASWDTQSKEREGHMQDLLSGQVGRASTAVMVVTEGASSFFNFSALILSAFLLNMVAASAIVVSVAVLFLALRPLALRARGFGKERSAATLAYADSLSETVSLLEEVQVFGVQHHRQAVVDRRTDRVNAAYFKAQFLGGLIGSIYQTLAIVLVVGGLAAVYAVGSGPLASLGAVVLILVRGLAYSGAFQSVYHRLNDLAPEMQRVRSAQERYREAVSQCGTRVVDRIDSIAFDDVGFAYRPDEPVLRDVSFLVARGEKVGIVGPSGAGKSTMVQLLLRLRSPSSGAYLINGIPADEFALDSWHSRIAYLPQEPRLLQGTVADNIRFYRDISDEEVIRAATLSGIHDEIMTWSQQYDTPIGQRVDAVSGGQRQRLCLARAIAGRPDFLVLDEPTSALDARSEALIQASLESLHGELTVFIVAHRLSTITDCDRIIVLQGGRLEAIAPPSQLAVENEFFRTAMALAGIA